MTEPTQDTTEPTQDTTQVAYRNRNDGNVYLLNQPRPDLDALDNFERVPVGDVPQAAQDALIRARAERAAIERAALTRAQRVELAAQEDIAVAALVATAVGQETPAMTAAHLAPEVTNPHQGVLERNRIPGPDQQELEARARRESQQIAATGVLSRNRPPTASKATITRQAGTGQAPVQDGTSAEPDEDEETSPTAAAGALVEKPGTTAGTKAGRAAARKPKA